MTIANEDLLLAVWNNDLGKVRELLNDELVNINSSMDETGWTPLILAVKKKNPEIVDILLNNSKLDINHEDIDGWTAYKHAVMLNKQFPNDPARMRIVELFERNPKLNKDLGKDPTGEFTFDVRRNNMGGKMTKRHAKMKKTKKSRKSKKSNKKSRKTAKRRKHMKK